jgi:hypothetical protein
VLVPRALLADSVPRVDLRAPVDERKQAVCRHSAAGQVRPARADIAHGEGGHQYRPEYGHHISTSVGPLFDGVHHLVADEVAAIKDGHRVRHEDDQPVAPHTQAFKRRLFDPRPLVCVDAPRVPLKLVLLRVVRLDRFDRQKRLQRDTPRFRCVPPGLHVRPGYAVGKVPNKTEVKR